MVTEPKIKFNPSPRYNADGIAIRFGSSQDSRILYDGTNNEWTVQTKDVGGTFQDRFRIEANTNTPDVDLVDNPIKWTSGRAVTAAQYSVGRDADGSNQLHLNVPTGATFEFSVNDAAQMVLGASSLTGNVVGSGASQVAAGDHSHAASSNTHNGQVDWDTAEAVTGTEYSAGRDADGTNQLHLNVPTGATFEFSVNDAAQMVLGASSLTGNVVGTGASQVAAGDHSHAASNTHNGQVDWDTAEAVTGTEYSVGRDADGTNQLHLNVPTGATFEFSVNDAAQMVLGASSLTGNVVGTGASQVAAGDHSHAASNTHNGQVDWDTAEAVTGTEYSVGRDADGTNQLHLNVPTGATLEFSVNDTAEIVLSATALDLKNNDLSNVGSADSSWTSTTLTHKGSGGIVVKRDGGSSQHYIKTYSDTDTNASSFNSQRARGTEASPTAVQSGNRIGTVNFQGYDGSNFSTGAQFRVVAAENFSGTARGSRLEIHTVDNTTTSLDRRWVFHDDGGLTEDTLASQGVGTINAKAVYDDSVLLTDFVFEPDYKLLSIREMVEFFTRRRRLPTIPGRDEWEQGKFSLGKLANHLWETVETHARYIGQLEGEIRGLRGQLATMKTQ